MKIIFPETEYLKLDIPLYPKLESLNSLSVRATVFIEKNDLKKSGIIERRAILRIYPKKDNEFALFQDLSCMGPIDIDKELDWEQHWREKSEQTIVPCVLKMDVTVCGNRKTISLKEGTDFLVVDSPNVEFFAYCIAMNSAGWIYRNFGEKGICQIFDSDFAVSKFVRDFNFEENAEKFAEILEREFTYLF